jgi:hypothetical protein
MTFRGLIAGMGLLAAAGLAGPAAAEELKLPEGKVAIHYHRADGKYEGWGLHAWESYQKKEEVSDEWAKKTQADRPLKYVTWFAPMKQAGQDDFGAYWLLDAGDFDNGRVNYIIHQGDKKEQCNQDKFFLIKDGKEAWVNSGDCKTYMSKEEALKARK